MSNLQENRQRGFTLLEVVFAVSILAIGIMGYTSLKISNRYSWVFAKDLSQAVNLTATQLEELLRYGYYNARMAVDVDTKIGVQTYAPTAYATAYPGDSLVSGDFIPSEVSWKVVDECPTVRTKMVIYTTTWGGGNRNMKITQVQVRP
jgi:prepilin-type N-terminal cleavage/methylation domain-containing protein